MVKQKKSRGIIFAGIAILAMLLLSAALSQTRLQPGVAVNLGDTSIQPGQYGTLFSGNFIIYLFDFIYLLSIAALLVITIYMLLTPERRKQLAKFLLRAVPALLLILLASNYVRSCSKQNAAPAQPAGPAATLAAGTKVPEAVFTPETSPVVMIVASIVLAFIIAGVIVFLIFRARRDGSVQTTPLMHLADKAQAALDAVQSGGDLKNAVLRCYFEMSRILLDQRSLKRDRSMTPHEFEALLVSNGMPGESVQMLTRLFEEVRYGTKVPGQREEWMAVTSLTAIVDACKRKG